jgi:microsomal prostaglandin-E synthase 2
MLTLRSLRKARGAVPLVAGGLACGVLTVRNRTLAASLCSAATSNPTPEIVLYQYKTCPFCNKVKSYLDYNQVDYAVVEVNPLTKSEIKFSKGYNKVPIATVNGELITDSSLIIEKVSTFAKYAASVKSDDSEKWSEWADKVRFVACDCL